jgi:hypothetical protein
MRVIAEALGFGSSYVPCECIPLPRPTTRNLTIKSVTAAVKGICEQRALVLRGSYRGDIGQLDRLWGRSGPTSTYAGPGHSDPIVPLAFAN